MINYLVDVLAYVRLYYLIMIGANYVTEAPLVSLYINIMGYSLLHHGVHGIWIWSIWFVGIIWIWHQSYGIASCCIALHCIGIWSYVMNLWFRPYRYSIVYWAQRCSFIPWVWRQEFICIHVHTSLVWHRDAASYLRYEDKSSCAFICFLYSFKGWMWWSIWRYYE